MSSYRIRAVFFDLDGTLIQSAQGFEKVFSELQLEAPPFDSTANFLAGVDWRALIDYLFRDRPKDIPDIYIAFLKYYEAHIHNLSQFYPHAEETLARLKENGIITGIISNKNHPQCLLLNQFLDFRVDILLGSGVIPFKKPHPAPLIRACYELDLKPWECLYIGDMPTDLEAAALAGMHGVYARYGLYHAFNKKFSSKISIDSLPEIFDFLGHYEYFSD
jgi:phosphoglycolate phosphatase